MMGKFSLSATSFTTLLIGFTLCGWLGTASAVIASAGVSSSELSGYVYADVDIDGYRDPLEAGIADVEIVLTKLSDPDFSIVTLSSQNGYYEFSELDAGVYFITQPTLAEAARNVFVREGELRDIVTDDLLPASYAGTAVLLDQAQDILPHVEGIDLPDRARGSNYNFGQIYLGKAWFTTAPPPVVPERIIPEPSTGLLLTIGALMFGVSQHRRRRQ